MKLDPTAVAAGMRHIALDSIGSTNAEALSCARADEPGLLWITAQTQTAGRGRRANEWVSPPGNLYATLLLREPSSPSNAPQLSFVAALALHDAIAACAPQCGAFLKLKWPNDVLLGGAKLAGILIEGTNAPPQFIAVGLGVNCVSHPPGTPYPATDLAVAGALISKDQLFASLSVAMLRRLDQWQRGEGFASVRADWLKRAAGIGEEICVRLPERETAGVFDGLDPDGRLILRRAGATEAITAGEVFAFGAGG